MDAPTDPTGSAADARSGPSGPPRVVVGIDGSPAARSVLVEALLAAARRGADLDVVACFSVELHHLGGPPVDVPDVARIHEDVQARTRVLVDDVLAEAAVSTVPGVAGVEVRLVVAQGAPAHVLVERSRGAGLLVVGSRGRGAARSALLGSVALHSATHATCPVLVVHPSVGYSSSPRVVVGVDGSAVSREACAAADEEAARRGAVLEVVVTYRREDYWTDGSTVVIPSVEEIHRRLHALAEQVVAEVRAGRPAAGDDGPPETVVAVVEGHPGEVLVHRARTADLLVVGSRGHGTVRGLLLGSVALHCAAHGQCPVLVVHPRAGRTPGPVPAVTAAPGGPPP